MKQVSSPPRGLLRGAHAAGLLFIILPLFDVALNVWPFRLDVNWRYGTVGLLSNYLLTPLLGVMIIGLTAGLARQRRILMVVAWGALLVGLLTLAAILMFGLDGLQLRASVPPAGQRLFITGAIKAICKLALMGTWLLGFGVAAYREARAQRASSGRVDDAGLIVRRPRTAGAATTE